ncbi:MAG: hypothetical protein IPK16_26265 [Anaerolineales bacterium]|nr:hypothetical protein [Anaerolineales bacterium]
MLALGVNPFMLMVLAQVFEAGHGVLPQNRSKLLAAFADTLLERERKRWQGDGWPGADAIRQALAELAYAMQATGERGTAVTPTWAMEHLAEVGCVAKDVLYLGRSATLLDASGDNVRFFHQLIQEYFAALEWQTRFAVDEELLRYWPDGWLEPTGWEETAILLTGMLPDISTFVSAMASVNPVLAARCVAESGADPRDDVIASVQAALIAVATSCTEPVPARHAAGDALNILGDLRPGVDCRRTACRTSCGAMCRQVISSWVNIKATDSMAYDDEAPQHRPNLDSIRSASIQ